MNRRSFLKLIAGAAVAAAVLPNLPKPKPEFDPMKYKGEFEWRNAGFETSIVYHKDVKALMVKLAENTKHVWEERYRQEWQRIS